MIIDFMIFIASFWIFSWDFRNSTNDYDDVIQIAKSAFVGASMM